MIILSISSAEDQLRQNQGLVMAMDMAMVLDMVAMDIVIVMVIMGDFMVMDFLEVIIGRLTSIYMRGEIDEHQNFNKRFIKHCYC